MVANRRAATPSPPPPPSPPVPHRARRVRHPAAPQLALCRGSTRFLASRCLAPTASHPLTGRSATRISSSARGAHQPRAALLMPLGANFVDDFTRYSLEDDIRRADELRSRLSLAAGRGRRRRPRRRPRPRFPARLDPSAFLGEAVLDSKYSLPREAPHGRLELKFAGEGGGDADPLRHRHGVVPLGVRRVAAAARDDRAAPPARARRRRRRRGDARRELDRLRRTRKGYRRAQPPSVVRHAIERRLRRPRCRARRRSPTTRGRSAASTTGEARWPRRLIRFCRT